MDLLDYQIKLADKRKIKSGRVKNYLKAYSVSSLTTTKTEIVRSSKQLAAEDTEKTEKSGNSKQLKNDLFYEISVAVSDKFEVLRDLATYEYELNKKIDVSYKINRLLGYLGSLPQFTAKEEHEYSDQKDIIHEIETGIDKLCQIKCNKKTAEHKSEVFVIREPNEHKRMKILYKGVKVISGIRVMICIKGDNFFQNLLISLVTCDEDFAINVPIKLDILDVNILNQDIKFETHVNKKLVPHLYLNFCEKKISVRFDKDFPAQKISVVFFLKNWGWTSAILKVADENIVISLTDLKYEKKISKTILLSHEQALQKLSLKTLRKFLSEHLKYAKGKDEEYAVWMDSPKELFQKKESSSMLMKEEYIKESLGTQQFIRNWKCDLLLEGKKYLVECFTYNTLIKFVVSSEEKVLEFKSGQFNKSGLDMFRFIASLEYCDMAKSPFTVCNSLEMRRLIKTYFNFKKLT